MEQKPFADGFGSSFTDLLDSHEIFFNGTEYLIVGQQDRKNHFVSFHGAYVLTFDPATETWTKSDFESLFDDENDEKLLMTETKFVYNSKLYILIYKYFGEFQIHALFEWNGDVGFQKIPIEVSFELTAARSVGNNKLYWSRGAFDDGRIAFLQDGNHFTFHLFQFFIDDQGVARFSLAYTTPSDINIYAGSTATSCIMNNRVLIAIFNRKNFWQSGIFIVVNFNESEIESHLVDITFANKSPTSQRGPLAHAPNPTNGDWIVVVATDDADVESSRDDCRVFVLKNIFNDPSNVRWIETNVSVKSGLIFIDDQQTIWSFNPKTVFCSANLDLNSELVKPESTVITFFKKLLQ